MSAAPTAPSRRSLARSGRSRLQPPGVGLGRCRLHASASRPPASLAAPRVGSELGKLPLGMGSLKLSRALVAGDSNGFLREGAHRRGGRTPGSPAWRRAGPRSPSGPPGTGCVPASSGLPHGHLLRKTPPLPRPGRAREASALRDPGWAHGSWARFLGRKEDRPGLELLGGSQSGVPTAGRSDPGDWVRPWPQGWGGARRALPPPDCGGAAGGMTSHPSSPPSLVNMAVPPH